MRSGLGFSLRLFRDLGGLELKEFFVLGVWFRRLRRCTGFESPRVFWRSEVKGV